MKVKRLSANPRHHFFGYYGINPWDSTTRYHLALETDFHTHRPLPEDVATVGLIHRDTHKFIPRAKTSAFNLQQGSMMHWINGGAGEEFTFNDWEDGTLVSRAMNPTTGTVRTIQGAIAAVSLKTEKLSWVNSTTKNSSLEISDAIYILAGHSMEKQLPSTRFTKVPDRYISWSCHRQSSKVARIS